MAPSSSSPAANNLEELKLLVDTAVELLEGLQKSIRGVVDSGGESSVWRLEAPKDYSLDALALARDSASLIKAHATKLSLLIITEPFTPTAVSGVLRQLVEGPIPALGSAVQQCHAQLYTKLVRVDMAWRCGRVLDRLQELIEKVPLDGKVLPKNKREGFSVANSGKGSITMTGLLWSDCEEVISFANKGVIGRLVERAEHFREILEDVMEEIRDWSERQDGDDEDDEDEDDDWDDGNNGADDNVQGLAHNLSNININTQAMIDAVMNAHATIPRDDPDKIRERLSSTIRRLRLTILLYKALAKRRLKTLPKLPLSPGSLSVEATAVSRLDEVMPLLRTISDDFNSLTLAFYELDSAKINHLMDQCFFDAFAVSELLAKPWYGQRDEFTDWASKFQVEIKKN